MQNKVCNALPLIVIPVIAILVWYLKFATLLLVDILSMNEKVKANVKFTGINLIYLLLWRNQSKNYIAIFYM